MFDALRKMILPIIIIVLVFFVAMIVLQWGLDITGQRQFQTARYAGLINGEKVTWDAFQSVYSNLYQEASRETEDELSEEKIIELEKSAWQQVLQDRLLLQEAAKYNIAVTEDDVYLFLRLSPPPYLRQYPRFLTEDQFDYQKYVNAMADPQWAPFWSSMEPQVRLDLRKLKMQQRIIEAANITENEIRQAFLDTEEMINVSYVRFTQPAPTLTDEALLAYYEEHKQDYVLDERAVLDIVMAEKRPTAADWEISHGRAQEFYDSVMAGADFAELARRYSEDAGSAPNGGDLGWFEPGRMVGAFDSVAFSLQDGDLSEPFATRFGWHVVLHHGYRQDNKILPGKTEPEKVTSAHVSHILIETKPSQSTLDAAYRQVADFQSVATASGFDEAARDTSVKVLTTSPFYRNRSIQHIGMSPEANGFAFESEAGAVSDIFENEAAYFVLRAARRIPKGPGEYDEVKIRVRQDLSRMTIAGLSHDSAAVIYADLQQGTDFEQAARRHDEEVDTPEPFARNDFVTGLGRDPKAIGAAFSLTAPGQISPPVDHGSGTVVFSLIERTPADLSVFNEIRDSIFTELLQSKQQALYGRWFNDLVNNAEIENNVERQRQLAGTAAQ